MSDYQQIMHELFIAQQNFKKEWNEWRNPKVKPARKKKLKELKGQEPSTVSMARNKFQNVLSQFHFAKLSPLEIKFNEKPLEVIDEIIEFLSVDVPCHRCGYTKEKFLTKLKSVSLTSEQRKHLQQIVLNLCKVPRYRREFGDWARLMIKIADRSFIDKLNYLTKDSNEKIRLTSEWLKNKIVENRRDLQSENN